MVTVDYFSNINLADVGNLTARVASGNVGGKIEFRVDSVTGEVIGTVDVPLTFSNEKNQHRGWRADTDPDRRSYQFAKAISGMRQRPDQNRRIEMQIPPRRVAAGECTWNQALCANAPRPFAGWVPRTALIPSPTI